MATRLIVLWLLSVSAVNAETGPLSDVQTDWERRLARAESLRQEGSARKEAADTLYEQKYLDCFKKFLVISCQKDANAERVVEIKAARLLENEGKAIERQVRKEQLSDKDLRRSAEAPQREAELQTRAAEISAARQATEAQEAATRADKAKKAEEGAKRKAEDAERLRQKQEDHDARVARKKAEAEQQAAKTERK